VKLEGVLVRVVGAVMAVVAMVIATPLHLAHSHDDSNPDRMRAPCMACQIHLPASTGAELTAEPPAPSVSRGIPTSAPETPLPSNSAAPNACRAPPLLSSIG
jgi:hypothetical protein